MKTQRKYESQSAENYLVLKRKHAVSCLTFDKIIISPSFDSLPKNNSLPFFVAILKH
jgi:hypothetical protein